MAASGWQAAVTKPPTRSSTSPPWMMEMPAWRAPNLKCLKCAQMRLATSSAPSRKPPGRGMPWPNLAFKGYVQYHALKYSFCTCQTPQWTCSSVPRSTRTMDRTSSQTVSLSEERKANQVGSVFAEGESFTGFAKRRGT